LLGQEGPSDRYTQTADNSRPHPSRTVQTPRALNATSNRSRATVSTLCRRRCPASDRVRCPRSTSTSVHPGHVERPERSPRRWGSRRVAADDQRNVSGRAVGRGGRPPWCPLAPSSRPSQGVHPGRLSGRVSEWCPAVGSGASIRPPVVPGGRRRAGGAGAGDRRGGAWPRSPTVAGHPRQPRRRASGPQGRTSQRVYHGASRDIPALWRI
jgi:hypothetical protein